MDKPIKNRIADAVSKIKFMKVLLHLILFLIITTFSASAINPPDNITVQLESGMDQDYVEVLQEHTADVLEAINHHYKEDEWYWPEELAGDPGTLELEMLLEDEGYYHILEKNQTYVSQTGSIFSIGELVLYRRFNELIEVHELVLFFDEDGTFVDAEKISATNSVAPFVMQQEPAEEEISREIKALVEEFRQAYNNRNLDAVGNLLHPDARVIAAVQLPDGRTFYRRNITPEYVQTLQSIFDDNPEVHLRFEEIEVLAHPFVSHLYGVHLKQYWDATNYSDEGNLFIIVDMQQSGQSGVQVRSWKSAAFRAEDYPKLIDGETIVADITEFIKQETREARAAREEVPEPEPEVGYAEVSANTDSLNVSIYTADGDTLKSREYAESEFRLELEPASYMLGVTRSGYEHYETDFTIEAGLVTDITIEMQPIPIVADKEPGWFSRNRWFVAAGAALIAGSAILLLTSGGDDGPDDIPLPPGRP